MWHTSHSLRHLKSITHKTYAHALAGSERLEIHGGMGPSPFPYDMPASSARLLPGCPYHGSALRSFQNLPVMCSHSLSAPAKGQHCTCSTLRGTPAAGRAAVCPHMPSRHPNSALTTHLAGRPATLACLRPRWRAAGRGSSPLLCCTSLCALGSGRQADRRHQELALSLVQAVGSRSSLHPLLLSLPSQSYLGTRRPRRCSGGAARPPVCGCTGTPPACCGQGPGMRVTSWCVIRVCIHTAGPLVLQTGIELHACASSTHTRTRTRTSTAPLAPHAIHRPGPAFLGIPAAGAEGVNQHATSSGAGVRRPTLGCRAGCIARRCTPCLTRAASRVAAHALNKLLGQLIQLCPAACVLPASAQGRVLDDAQLPSN